MVFKPEKVVLAGVEALAAKMESFATRPRARRALMDALELAFAPSTTSISPP
jgi:hypothetical protein